MTESEILDRYVSEVVPITGWPEWEGPTAAWEENESEAIQIRWNAKKERWQYWYKFRGNFAPTLSVCGDHAALCIAGNSMLDWLERWADEHDCCLDIRYADGRWDVEIFQQPERKCIAFGFSEYWQMALIAAARAAKEK